MSRRHLRWGVPAAAAVLAGCMNLAPRYERPAAPVAAGFPLAPASAPAGAASAPAAADLDWQSFVGDERLKRLIALSLQNNRDLRIAALNIEATRAQAQVRDADRWPTLNAGLTGSRQPTASGGINSLYTAGFQVTAYEVDLFGRLRNLSDAAAAQVLASEEARKAVQISLVSAVATAHIALAADDELLRVPMTLDLVIDAVQQRWRERMPASARSGGIDPARVLQMHRERLLESFMASKLFNDIDSIARAPHRPLREPQRRDRRAADVAWRGDEPHRRRHPRLAAAGRALAPR